MPRRLARPCPLPLYTLPAHVVVYWFVLGPLWLTFENCHEVKLYDAAVSGTAVSALPLRSSSTPYCVQIIPSHDYV